MHEVRLSVPADCVDSAIAVVAANWDSLVLDVGSDPLRRIPMMEPTRGSKLHVEQLFTEVSTPRQLVERLASP